MTVGLIGAAALIVLITKTSCPFAYLDRGEGWELVGEAYSGAAFRSIQRDDLLPLPAVGSAESVRVMLRNEARETQYTDRAELVVVDHPDAVRAVSTYDGRIVLVGRAHAAERAHDRRGTDVAAAVFADDHALLESTPDEVAAAADDSLEDHWIGEFAAPSQGRPVLEIVAANTDWLDLVFGRFFAAMGKRLPRFLAEGNAREAGPRILRWREREAVDLIVEVRSGDRWQRVAVIPTIGAAALREVAVPLPGHFTPEQRLTVRVRGGLGFWRIGRISMSAESDPQPLVHRIAPSHARTTAGADRLSAIASTDGVYDALHEWNEGLEMHFTLPTRTNVLQRSAFLFTNGYYNVHLPVQPRWQPVILKTIREEPGALSRFSRDLARAYMRRESLPSDVAAE